MLIALLIAAQPAPAAEPAPAEPAVDVTDSLIAYRDWRLCIDARLGLPPRLRVPSQAAVEAALASCRSHEESLRQAIATAFGPAQGAELFAGFAARTRTEIAAPHSKR